jgi:hypothetical protein
MPNERSTQLADDFAAVNAEVIAFASSCSEKQWRTVVPGEEWTVGVVIHHIAEGHTGGLQWLESMARGEAVTTTSDDIDSNNSEHADRCTEVGVAETVALLEVNGGHLEAALRQFTDEDLERSAPFGPAEGQVFQVVQLAAAMTQHPRGHLAHVMEAVNASD